MSCLLHEMLQIFDRKIQKHGLAPKMFIKHPTANSLEIIHPAIILLVKLRIKHPKSELWTPHTLINHCAASAIKIGQVQISFGMV